MPGSFGVMPIFDHLAQDWRNFKSRFLQWVVANDIKDANENKRRAVLLCALSENTYKLACDLALPKKIDDIEYDEIVSLLDKHFIAKVQGFSERYKFYAAAQQPGETHAQWAARLRGLTADCGFSDVEEALRDRFIMGMLACPERSKLFEQDIATLTMAKAVELAESGRCARAAGAVVGGAGQVYSVRQGERDGGGAGPVSEQVNSVQQHRLRIYNNM